MGIRYRHDVNSGKWECYVRNNAGTDTVADSGVTVAAATDYELAISINKANTEITFWINQSVVARITTGLANAVAAGTQIHMEKSVGTTTYTTYVYRMVSAAFSP